MIRGVMCDLVLDQSISNGSFLVVFRAVVAPYNDRDKAITNNNTAVEVEEIKIQPRNTQIPYGSVQHHKCQLFLLL
jgi:hypothetical protein